MKTEKEFMLTFRGSHANWNSKSETEWQELNHQHTLWIEKLKDRCKSGAKLASKASIVLAGDKNKPRVTDGPFTETKELLTGFYVISANDMKHAVELGTGCPWLLHDVMEIFEIENQGG